MGDEINGDMVLEQVDIGMGPDLLQQGALHLPAGHVLGVDDPVAGMAAFTAEVETLGWRIAVTAEADTPADQRLNAPRAFFDNQVDDVGMAETGARGQSVLDVKIERVITIEHGRNTALGLIGIALHGLFFGNQRDTPDLGGVEGKQQPGNPTANDQEIGLMFFHRVPEQQMENG
jgi:hypothetical protein